MYKILYSADVIFRLGCGRGTFLSDEILKVPNDLRAFRQKPQMGLFQSIYGVRFWGQQYHIQTCTAQLKTLITKHQPNYHFRNYLSSLPQIAGEKLKCKVLVTGSRRRKSCKTQSRSATNEIFFWEKGENARGLFNIGYKKDSRAPSGTSLPSFGLDEKDSPKYFT